MLENKNVAAKTNLTEAETTVCFTQPWFRISTKSISFFNKSVPAFQVVEEK